MSQISSNDNINDNIKKGINEIRNELKRIELLYEKTLSYASMDPEVSLIQARKAAEAICRQLFIDEISDNIGNLMLNTLIDKLVAKKILPKHIVVPLRTIQNYGNYGVHEHGDLIPKEITYEYIHPCLSSLATVITWYFNEYHCSKKVFIAIESSDISGAKKSDDRIDQNTLYKNKQNLVSKTQLERLAFVLSINADDNDVQDYKHHYKLIKRIDYTDSATGMYTSYRWLTIRNDSDVPTNEIFHMECGENKINFDSMKLRAFENSHQGNRIKVTLLTELQPSFVQKVKISFLKPLAPGEEKTIFYRFNWPGELLSYSGESHSQSISLLRYKKGVSKLQFGVIDKKNVMGVYCEEIGADYGIQRVNTVPAFINAEEDDDIKPLHNKGLKGFLYNFEKVCSVAFRFYYQFVIDMESESNDDF